jgi:hypothetical protein
MADKKTIGGLVKLIANLGLDYLQPRVLAALKEGSLTWKLAASVFEPLRASIAALSDDIEDNSAQLSGIWVKYLHNDVRPILMEAAAPVIDDIGNETDKALAAYLLNIVNDCVGIVTDDIAGNKDQFKAYFAELQKSEKTREVVINKLLNLADAVVKDKGLLAMFSTILNAVFDLIQGKELEPETARLLAGEEK